MKRVAIINFTGFRGNWGCQATSFELLKFIAGCFPAGTPLKFDAVPLLPTSRVDQSYDGALDRVFAAFTDVAQQTDQAQKSLAYLTTACEARYGFWADIVRSADLVVFQAEGSMGLGANFARGPRLMLLPFVAKHAWGRRVVSLNQSFYSHDPAIRQNAAEAFSGFDFTAFREGASVALARQCGVSNAAYVPDCAFMSQPSGGPDLPASAKGYFAVSGSALKDPRRYDLILDQTRQIAARTGLRPLIAVSRDLKMKAKVLLGWRPGSYATVRSNATYTQVTRQLAQCQFLLGGRYHMSIMSAAAGTPNIILTGNSFKNEGLVSLLAADRPVHGFADTDAIVHEAEAVVANNAAERAKLSTQVDVIRKTIGDAQRHIAAILDGQTPGPFVDDLPAYDLTPDILARYEAYGQGKGKSKSRAVPGARLGTRETASAFLPPLLEGLAGDSSATLATLRKMAAADPQFRAELDRHKPRYPALADL